MAQLREPRVKPIKISELHPTQITIGMREVDEKRKRWRSKDGSQGAKFLGRHMIPVVIGPKKRHYIIDHHHLARALHDEGVRDILITVMADLTKLGVEAFWVYLDSRNWAHPFDETGKRRSYKYIPTSINELVDDPFRSLAGELRRAGGFAKDTTPFSEFLWADYLRRQIKGKIVKQDFSNAVEIALRLAKNADANYLPGWCGPSPED